MAKACATYAVSVVSLTASVNSVNLDTNIVEALPTTEFPTTVIHGAAAERSGLINKERKKVHG